MNDTHDGSYREYGPIIFRASKLKNDHPEYLLGTSGKHPKIGSWTAVDYGRPEIRELAFRYVEEVCQNYDVDGIDLDFLQDSHSLSTHRGVLRALHYQLPPFAQDKLIRVASGSVFDVAVDLRRDSPTFGQHVSFTLHATDWKQLLVPRGFAHGFVTREPDTVFTYKVSAYYSPEYESGIRFDDAWLGIDWGADPDLIVTSEKDQKLPSFGPNGEECR